MINVSWKEGSDMKKISKLLLSFFLLFSMLFGCSKESAIEKDGWYSSKEEVAEYLEIYNELPDNYITKKEARDLGWISSEGNLWDVAYGMSIGGDVFGNREGLLPKEKGRIYYECDIDYEGGYRDNGKRIVYSNDGLIFYTEDHYNSFEELSDEGY